MNNIMKSDTYSDIVFELDFLARDDIVSITFRDSMENLPAAGWMISEEGSNPVYLCVEEAPGTNGKYNMYIAAEGGVRAPENCNHLFYGYENLEKIYFNGNFHTDYVKNMHSMFSNCSGLQELDLSSFNTSRVTCMNYMFYGHTFEYPLDISHFDTSKVVSMNYMFYNPDRAFSADSNEPELLVLGSFDTTKVESFDDFLYGEFLPDGRRWSDLFKN